MDDVRIERVLRCVESIPAGRIAPYSMVGRVTGESARIVGRIMSTYGSNVPWWRVTNVRGELPGALASRATAHWEAEAIDHDAGTARLRMCLADEETLQTAFSHATSDLQ